MKDTIFYSCQDADSPKLLDLLKGSTLARKFIYYRIDSDKDTGKRNEDLLTICDVSRTPTLVADNTYYVGTEALDYVKKRTLENEMADVQTRIKQLRRPT